VKVRVVVLALVSAVVLALVAVQVLARVLESAEELEFEEL
jgi:undecaprenyl pyrophosphate phosphatase UppP